MATPAPCWACSTGNHARCVKMGCPCCDKNVGRTTSVATPPSRAVVVADQSDRRGPVPSVGVDVTRLGECTRPRRSAKRLPETYNMTKADGDLVCKGVAALLESIKARSLRT